MKYIIFSDELGIKQFPHDVSGCLVSAIIGSSIREASHESLKLCAEKLGVPFIVQPKKDDSDYSGFLEKIKTLSPDLFIVNSYSLILREDLLSIPVFGAVNLHGALLPKYRGANPVQWAIINGENEIGVTLHEMDRGLDSGPIIHQVRIELRDDDTWIDAFDKIADTSTDILGEYLPLLKEGKWKSVAQEHSESSQYPRRKPDDGLISWDMPPTKIYNMIRALVHPLPGVYYHDRNGNKVFIREFMSMSEVVAMQNKINGGTVE